MSYSSDARSVDFPFFLECFQLSGLTLTVLIMTEYLTWSKLWKAQYDKDIKVRNLYWEGWKANLIHYFVIGPLAYGAALLFITRFVTPWPLYIALPGVLLTQAVGYATAHRFMHRKENYWMHKYHHQYNESTFVRPLAANSVTLAEFSLAYVAPIVTGALLFRPSSTVLFITTTLISMTNLMIHTPLELLPMSSYLPDMFVTNEKHFHHHQKNQMAHYSAPIFDLDGVLGMDKDAPEEKASN